MGFNALNKLWLLALAIPVLVFYFLKLKRSRMQIPSLLLWSRVLNDKRVNSPFQRFKRHLLLLLQLLILAFLVFAAVEPYFYGASENAKRIPILIDNSASMAAITKDGGISRLDIAKKRIRKIITEKVSGQEFSLVIFSDTARKVCGFTDNSRILLDALEKIEVEDVAGNIEDALRMLQAIARNYDFDEVLLLSDGNFNSKVNFNLSFNLNFQKLHGDPPNVGITALNAQRTLDEDWIVFV